MLILTILLSVALAAGFTLLPARVQPRKPARADVYAGAGVTALVWLWAVCIWSRLGLTADFDGFRLAAILAMQGLSCGVVCGFRLRGALPQKLRTPAAVVLLLVASLGAEIFIGNLNWLATSRYTQIVHIGHIKTSSHKKMGNNEFITNKCQNNTLKTQNQKKKT